MCGADAAYVVSMETVVPAVTAEHHRSTRIPAGYGEPSAGWMGESRRIPSPVTGSVPNREVAGPDDRPRFLTGEKPSSLGCGLARSLNRNAVGE